MNTFFRLFAVLSAVSACAGSVPSQRDSLNQQYLKVRPEYTAAVRSGDKQKFVAAVTMLQALGQAVVSANAPAISALRAGAYPPDVKSRQARETWDQKVSATRSSLLAANSSLSAFSIPAEITPESVRAAEAYMTTIFKAIETHHAACLNIR